VHLRDDTQCLRLVHCLAVELAMTLGEGNGERAKPQNFNQCIVAHEGGLIHAGQTDDFNPAVDSKFVELISC